MNVGEASLLMGANAEGPGAELFDKEIKDFSIDSRSVGAGELFFALSQEDYARAGFNGTGNGRSSSPALDPPRLAGRRLQARVPAKRETVRRKLRHPSRSQVLRDYLD